MFSCLVAASRQSSWHLEPACSRILSKRVQMMDMAVKVKTVRSAHSGST